MPPHLDYCNNPWNKMLIIAEASAKERKAIERKEAQSGVGRVFRFQAPGEQVLLSGLRNQTQLNDVQGELVSQRTDENGFLFVKVPKWARTTRAGVAGASKRGETRVMKVQPQYLLPMRCPTDTRPRGGRLREFVQRPDDDLASVKSCTDTIASCRSRLATPAPSRRSTPALSASGAASAAPGHAMFRAASAPTLSQLAEEEALLLGEEDLTT
eukprot:gnl/TRDRNA2_/TRDRNA2_183356_c0_seq1.p1 gnl/TRDRNA2_/TRDRNA2_183356_c0~~gnl/TRDRNA2_/TRDRNA2_183356_c0_seq1.p1  ORF type:complete len:213 (+),score=28.72 gnl/TRDRNA2_/TRDRNA2_183356_c0_seq1:85-723(+)